MDSNSCNAYLFASAFSDFINVVADTVHTSFTAVEWEVRLNDLETLAAVALHAMGPGWNVIVPSDAATVEPPGSSTTVSSVPEESGLDGAPSRPVPEGKLVVNGQGMRAAVANFERLVKGAERQTSSQELVKAECEQLLARVGMNLLPPGEQ